MAPLYSRISTILSDGGASVNLLPFALTLAHAGAAVIVPQRALVWPPKSLSENREGAVVICAERWLVDHTKVFNDGEPTADEKNTVVHERYAYVGPRLCDPAGGSHCNHLTGPFPGADCSLRRYCRHALGVPAG